MIGGVDEAVRLVLLHLNDGKVGERRLLSPESVKAVQRITPRGGKRIFGLVSLTRGRAAAPGLVEHLGGGAGFYNVMRIYPEDSLGVMMGNTTLF